MLANHGRDHPKQAAPQICGANTPSHIAILMQRAGVPAHRHSDRAGQVFRRVIRQRQNSYAGRDAIASSARAMSSRSFLRHG
jgi:hypothetical protein